MRSTLFLLMFTLVGFTSNDLRNESTHIVNKRVFCESDESSLPYIKFNFYPEISNDSVLEGNVVIAVDKGAVLDINTYDNVSMNIDNETATFDYVDGRLVFILSGDFEHEGSIKHFLSGGILKEKVTCYFLNSTQDLLFNPKY